MNAKLLKETVDKNELLDWQNDVMQDIYWETMISELTKDVDETIAYILHECTDYELFWISPVFEDIIEKTQSKKLLKTFQKRLDCVTQESFNKACKESQFIRENCDLEKYKHSIKIDIDFAKQQLKDR